MWGFNLSYVEKTRFKIRLALNEPQSVIRNGVWVEYGATPSNRVVIGGESIVGICSIVNKDVEPIPSWGRGGQTHQGCFTSEQVGRLLMYKRGIRT